jgi:hypothetical protein
MRKCAYSRGRGDRCKYQVSGWVGFKATWVGALAPTRVKHNRLENNTQDFVNGILDVQEKSMGDFNPKPRIL